MDRMASMAAFTKVVGAGSFSAAAREMQVSQALVTKQIQELESWLGARLLNRTTAPGEFRSVERDAWISAVDANMLTPIFLIRETIDGMIARGASVIPTNSVRHVPSVQRRWLSERAEHR